MLGRYLEYLNKLEQYHLSFFKSYADSLKATRHLRDLPWPDIKPELWSEAARGFREMLIRVMADHIVLLSLSQKPEGVPTISANSFTKRARTCLMLY